MANCTEILHNIEWDSIVRNSTAERYTVSVPIHSLTAALHSTINVCSIYLGERCAHVTSDPKVEEKTSDSGVALTTWQHSWLGSQQDAAELLPLQQRYTASCRDH